MTHRPLALLMPGPMHLFWTSGVYYLLEIAETHDVVLVVSDSRYLRDNRMAAIMDLPFVREVCIVGHVPLWRRHRYTREFFANLLDKHRAEQVFIHNVDYPENMYLVEAFRRREPSGRVVHYQNGREVSYIQHDFEVRRAMDAQLLPATLPLRVRLAFVWLRDSALSLLSYGLLPLAARGQALRPVLNVYTAELRAENAAQWNGPADELAVYTEAEESIYRARGFVKVVRRDHPAKKYLQAVSALLVPQVAESNSVVVLPTAGNSESLLQTMTSAEVVEHLTRCWTKVLSELGAQYPGWELIWKLHPAAASNKQFIEVTRRLLLAFPALRVVPANQSAEPLIVASKVVAGDTSSALWWAALIGKKAISFDYFGYKNGAEMGVYGNVECRYDSATIVTAGVQ